MAARIARKGVEARGVMSVGVCGNSILLGKCRASTRTEEIFK